MKPNPTIELLVADMAARQRQASLNPYILFLGRDCERAAGVPPAPAIARQVFEGLQKSQPDQATTWLPQRETASPDDWSTALENYLGSLSGVERYAVLQPFYSRVPVPQFYQDLARLVRAGYFRHIFTTNIDALLEQALRATGFYPGQHYQVTTLGTPTQKQRRTLTDATRLIKLRGDLGQSLLPITPSEIWAALGTSPSVMDKLAHDLILVGYQFGEHPPTEDWLREMPGGRLWWVRPDPPDPQQIKLIAAERDFQVIDAEYSQPGAFFGELALRLLRLPVTVAMDTALQSDSDSEVSDSNIDTGGKVSIGGSFFTSGGDFVGRDQTRSIPRTSDEQLELEALRRQLSLSQDTLARLEQQRNPDAPNPYLETQITYQRQQISRLKDRLLSQPAGLTRLVDLMQGITQSAEQAHQNPNIQFTIDSDTMDYLHSLRDTVKRETSKSPPNRLVLSGAIGATLSMVRGFGLDVVRPDHIGELAALAPCLTEGRPV